MTSALFGGLIAGSLEAVVTMPFEVIKTRQQINNSSGDVLGQLRSLGVRNLFVGLPIMIAQSGGKVAIRFSAYSELKNLLPDYSKHLH